MSNETKTIEERISEKTDLTIAGSTEVSSAVGGLQFKDMGQVMEFSKLMAVAGQAVPKHLRGAPGACLGLVTQALGWRMDPFAVANKSYMVNDRIAYEAQLVHAVIEQRAPITGRIKGKLEGEGNTRRWILSVKTNDGDEITFQGQEVGKITTKNSPLWKSDPDQQLWYYSVRAMCRRHFPDVLLGVYVKDEIEDAGKIRDVTPPQGGFAAKAQAARQPQEPTQTAEDESATKEVPNDEDAPNVEDAEIVTDDDTPEPFNPDPFSNAYNEGRIAFDAGDDLDSSEYEGDQLLNFKAGFNFEANKGAE